MGATGRRSMRASTRASRRSRASPLAPATWPRRCRAASTVMVSGILSVGLVLVYRSTRIINFAHGQIGAFGAALMGVAVVRWHVPYWMAFPGALAVSAGIGSGAEAVVVRRLRNAPLIM